jgi:hypothetical protein
MASKFLQRLNLAAVLVAGLGLVLAQTATALPRPGAPRTRPEAARGFNLFAGLTQLPLNANRVLCGVNNRGYQCHDYTDSPVLGGAYWPKGSPDQYVFNGGLQLAAIIPGNRATFPWAGDTVGAFFFDGTGFYAVGSGITNVYDSRNADDLTNWPDAAKVKDPTLYDASVLGARYLSEQDTWLRFWDGNTAYVLGRQHPMGILVDQRTLAWNTPAGNEDIIYFINRFINITATDRTRYLGLSAYGYTSQDIDDILAVAQQFKAGMASKFNVAIPDTGFWFTRMYAGPTQDPDVLSGGSSNYSTAILPFALEYAYQSNFVSPTWQYPPDIFHAPFAVAPGFEGLKFLKGAADSLGRQLGVTMFTNTTNGGAFTDRSNVRQLWRLASNNLIPTDGSCNAPSNTPMCQLVQGATDTRMYMYSGPVTMKPGESQVVVVAMVYAPAVESAILTDGKGHNLGNTAFDMNPGVPGTPTGYLSATSRVGQTSLDTIRPIERAAGWNTAGNSAVGLDANGNGILEQNEIPRVPHSLLDESIVAQVIFDNKFLLPFPPESPNTYLIPGDNQVTVVWQPSPTESGLGDPYYQVASNSLSPLYDPNYRAHDVEGYRVWRGRTQSEMTMIAQFDYAGTYMEDYTGRFQNDDYGNQCAPDLGITTSCPSFPNQVSLVGNVIQVPAGKRYQLADGTLYITLADTAVTGGNSGYPPLTDTGVPFAFIDHSVRNGFTYWYAVTAFDINSVTAVGIGKTSKQSALVASRVTPRAPSANPAVLDQHASLVQFSSDNAAVDTTAHWPAMNATGNLTGPVPAGGYGGPALNIQAYVPVAVRTGNYDVTVDSVTGAPWPAGLGAPGAAISFWLTYKNPSSTIHHQVTPASTAGYGVAAGDVVPWQDNPLGLILYDSVAAAKYGITVTPGAFSMPVQFAGLTVPQAATSKAAPLEAGRFGTSGISTVARYVSHSRWYDQSGSEPPQPTTNSLADSAHHAGKLTGVGFIYSPNVYRQPQEGDVAAGDSVSMQHVVTSRFRSFAYSAAFWYPADFVITWNADSTITVRDSTHHAGIPFRANFNGWGWGFLDTLGYAAQTTATLRSADACTGTVCPVSLVVPTKGVINYRHLYFVDPVATYRGRTAIPLVNKAKILPLDWTNEGTQDGVGIALLINGEPFFMQMSSLPAAGTRWHLRAMGGAGMTATCTGSPPTYTTCSGYAFAPPNPPPLAPGMRWRLAVTQQASYDPTATSTLDSVHTVPDPYYVTNSLELTANTKVLRFVNLPYQAIIRIYSVSGILVNILTHNDPTGGGEQVWNLRNRNNQFVASGVYFYHVETPDGRKKIGRFTVVNYAQ